jgi:hypothetical protein
MRRLAVGEERGIGGRTLLTTNLPVGTEESGIATASGEFPGRWEMCCVSGRRKPLTSRTSSTRELRQKLHQLGVDLLRMSPQ